MSNVLIGIIGVILFIGLALAGALFLGPRFQESAANTKAAAALQAVNQVASAMQLYSVDTGKTVDMTYRIAIDDPSGILSSGYLKSVPINPVLGGNPPGDIYDPFIMSFGGASERRMVMMKVGQDEKASQICLQIALQTAQVPKGTTAVPADTNLPVGVRSGCIKMTNNTAYGNINDHVVWSYVN